MGRTLVVNADDFGFTRDVNSGIIEAHTRGILTATTIMAIGPAFDHAVRLAREHPTLDVGCHLVLVQGPGLPRTFSELMLALALRRIDPYAVLRSQVERILESALKPLHLDTHKHTHLLPPVLDAVARLSEEYRIPWVRRPFDLPLTGTSAPFGKRAVNAAVGTMRTRVHRKLAAHGCRTTDHFAGFQLTGRFQARDFVSLIEALPEGVTEFMCHPGHCTEELRAAATRLKESRAMELEALVAPEVREALDRRGVRLAGYRDLSK